MTDITKNEVNKVRSLRRPSERDEQDAFVVEGPKVVQELIASDWEVRQVFATHDHDMDHEKLARVSAKDLERMSQLKNPNKVLAVARRKHFTIQDLLADEVILVLDEVSDPGNLGTMVRTADWFGIHSILCSTNSVDPYNAKVVQASMGSLFRMKIVRTDIAQALSGDLDHTVYGACMEGQDIGQVSFNRPCMVVMGSESHGISPDVEAHITRKVTIPGSDQVDSLNVSIAAGIFMAAIAK